MLSSRQSSAQDHGSRSGSRHATIGNSWQDGEDMCASSGGKKTAGANARPRQALLSSLQPVFPCGLMQGKREMSPSRHPNLQLSRTTIHFWSGFSGGQGCVAQDWGQLLIFQGKSCSHFRAFTKRHDRVGNLGQCSDKSGPMIGKWVQS